jgi:hypothetical protein
MKGVTGVTRLTMLTVVVMVAAGAGRAWGQYRPEVKTIGTVYSNAPVVFADASGRFIKAGTGGSGGTGGVDAVTVTNIAGVVASGLIATGRVAYADAAGTASSVSLFALGTNAMTPEAYAAFTAGGGGITPQDVASIVVTSHVASASSVTNDGAQMLLTGGGIKLALTNYLVTAYDIRDPEWVYAEELNFRDPLQGNTLTLRGTSMVRSNDFWALLYEYPYGAYGQGFTAEYAAKVDWSGITNVPPVTWESVTNKPGLLQSDVPGSGAYTVGTLGVLGSIRGSGATTMDVVPELVPVSGQVGVADHWWLKYAGIRIGDSESVVTAFGSDFSVNAEGVLGVNTASNALALGDIAAAQYATNVGPVTLTSAATVTVSYAKATEWQLAVTNPSVTLTMGSDWPTNAAHYVPVSVLLGTNEWRYNGASITNWAGASFPSLTNAGPSSLILHRPAWGVKWAVRGGYVQ